MASTNLLRLVHRMHETVRKTYLQIFWLRMCPIYLIRPKTHVLMHFARFCQYHNGKYELAPGCKTDARNCANELSCGFFRRTCPIHLIRPKSHVLMHFARFCQYQNGRYEIAPGCTADARNFANDLATDFSQRMWQIHLIRSKSQVLMHFACFCQYRNGKYELAPGCTPDAQNYGNKLS